MPSLISQLLVATMLTASSTNFVLVATGNTGAQWFVDMDTIKETSDYGEIARRAWVTVDYSKDRSTRTRMSKILFYIKCDSEEFRYETWIDYAPNGSVIKSSPATLYQPVAPQTIGAGIMGSICAPAGGE